MFRVRVGLVTDVLGLNVIKTYKINITVTYITQ